MIDRLADDHANARRLMHGIAEIQGLIAEPVLRTLFTFALLRSQDDRSRVVKRLREHDVWLLSLGPRRFRAVTHCWIDADDIEVVLNAMREAIKT